MKQRMGAGQKCKTSHRFARRTWRSVTDIVKVLLGNEQVKSRRGSARYVFVQFETLRNLHRVIFKVQKASTVALFLSEGLGPQQQMQDRAQDSFADVRTVLRRCNFLFSVFQRKSETNVC